MTDRDGAFERHATATAYIVAEGHTLLLWHHALGMWLPPGGHCEPNEDPVQAVKREALEESGLQVVIVPLHPTPKFDTPLALPPPAHILIEEIVREDQPFHHHIDHVYYTVPVEPVAFGQLIPHGPHRWVTHDELGGAFSLPAPDGRLVQVAEDVRLLGMQAINVVRDTS